MATGKTLHLRRQGTCHLCGATLPVGRRAHWDASLRTVTCLACSGPGARAEAGGSAQQEYERRRAARERRVAERHPHASGLLLGLTDDPQHVKSWQRGATGERRLGELLERDLPSGVHVLHDLCVPGNRANVDHVVVTARHVYVIDAKHYTGKIERVNDGWAWRPEYRLSVGGRDRTPLVTAMVNQSRLVSQVLARNGHAQSVEPVLCFVDGEWPLLARPFRVHDVTVTWPRALVKTIRDEAIASERGAERAARALMTHLGRG